MDGFFSKGMSLSGRITDLTSGNYVYIYISHTIHGTGIFPYILAYLLWFSWIGKCTVRPMGPMHGYMM